MKKENNFDSIEVKFKIVRRNKPEAELDSNIIIHKGKNSYPIDSYSIELFNKECLTESEKTKIDWLEGVKTALSNYCFHEGRYTEALTKFIKEVEKDPSIYYKTWHVLHITKDEFDNVQTTTDMSNKFKDTYKWLAERAHEYSK